MSKQDRQGVRTAQDLERKYDFSSMKKAVEMHEKGINKTNKSLEQFVNAVIRNFKEMRSALDGQAEIWFYGGVPAVDNLPASEWEDYSIHLGDLYYDTETGYGYRFESNGSAYFWERISDQDTIYALAIANSARDTKDNKRSVFLEQPEPPYGIGDLWLDGETLYVCQVAKDASGVYETADFILASRYVDGMVTLIDADLKRNYSTTVEMKAAIEASEEKMSVEMKKTYTSRDEFSQMETVVKEASTKAEQTAEGFRIITEKIENGELDGEDATTLRIDSSRGTVFKNSAVSTVLSAVIYKGPKRITDIDTLKSEYGSSAYLEWKWQRMGEDTFGTILSTDSRIGNDGFTFTLSPDDVDTKAVFLCNLITD